MRKMTLMLTGGLLLLLSGTAFAADAGNAAIDGWRPVAGHHGGHRSGRHHGEGRHHVEGCAGGHHGACPRTAK